LVLKINLFSLKSEPAIALALTDKILALVAHYLRNYELTRYLLACYLSAKHSIPVPVWLSFAVREN